MIDELSVHLDGPRDTCTAHTDADRTCAVPATLDVELTYCECVEMRGVRCDGTCTWGRDHVDRTSVCDAHGAQVRTWPCLTRIASRQTVARTSSSET